MRVRMMAKEKKEPGTITPALQFLLGGFTEG
jgi:hypothetical protein